MSTPVDICNLALSRLADMANVSGIDPPEGSHEADRCQRMYPLARDTLLEMYNWSFAMRRARLSETGEDTFGWRYAYQLPADVLHAVAVFTDQDRGYRQPWDFQIERTAVGTKVLYTDCPDAILRYTCYMEESGDFSPLFTDALAWLLASHLAGAIIKSESGINVGQACFKQFQQTMAGAMGRDIIQKQNVNGRLPHWLTWRRRGFWHESR